MKRLLKFNAFNALVWAATITLIMALITGLYIYFGNIVVLKDWHITTCDEVGTQCEKKTFYANEDIAFVSKSEKLMNVEGRAQRYLVCEANNQSTGIEVVLPSSALNRLPGANPDRASILRLPTDVAFQSLPRSCRLTIDACYTLYGVRSVCHSASTEPFTVLPSRTQVVQ